MSKTGNAVTNSCGVSFIYTGSGPNLAAGEYWEIYEIDSGDGLVCGIDPSDVGLYTINSKFAEFVYHNHLSHPILAKFGTFSVCHIG